MIPDTITSIQNLETDYFYGKAFQAWQKWRQNMNNKYKPKDFWKNNFGQDISTKCQTNIQRKLRRSLLNMLLKNKFTDNLRSCQENMSNKSFMMKLEEAKCYKQFNEKLEDIKNVFQEILKPWLKRNNQLSRIQAFFLMYELIKLKNDVKKMVESPRSEQKQISGSQEFDQVEMEEEKMEDMGDEKEISVGNMGRDHSQFYFGQSDQSDLYNQK